MACLRERECAGAEVCECTAGFDNGDWEGATDGVPRFASLCVQAFSRVGVGLGKVEALVWFAAGVAIGVANPLGSIWTSLHCSCKELTFARVTSLPRCGTPSPAW